MINETIRERENRDALLQLKNKFTSDFNLVVAGRYLVFQGVLIKRSKRSIEKEYMFHLFNDVLIYSAVQRNDMYKLKK